MRSIRRTGFTLFELLVILAVLALLAALLLPAVQKVRQAAARTQSMNNLKQIGIAAHNYLDANRRFPSGNDDNNFSTAAYLLPYLEQENLYRKIDFKKPIDHRTNEEARRTVVKLFLSPLDPRQAVSDDVTKRYGATNYLYNAGSKPSLVNNDGVFYQDSKVSIRNILDGTSNTVLAGETLKGDGRTKAMDVRRQHIAYKADALKNLKGEAGVADWKQGKYVAGNRCASWMDGRFLQGTFTGTRKINDERPDVDCGGQGGLSGLRSYHPRAIVSFCDGHVTTISAKVEPKVWALLAARNDGMVIPKLDD